MLMTVSRCLCPMATKRKLSDVADVDVKPRKALTVPEPRRISKLEDVRDMQSILGDAAEEIQQLLESNNNDSATTLMQKRLLQTLVDVIPHAEANIRKSQGAKGVYAFNSLITSIRELLIDVQSTRDRGVVGEMLVEKVIRPSFLDIGMVLVQEDARLDKELKIALGPKSYNFVKKRREESLTRTAEHIQKKYGEVKAQSIAFLQQ